MHNSTDKKYERQSIVVFVVVLFVVVLLFVFLVVVVFLVVFINVTIIIIIILPSLEKDYMTWSSLVYPTNDV